MDRVIQNILDHHFPRVRRRDVIIVCDSAKLVLAQRMVAIWSGQGLSTQLMDVTDQPNFMDALHHRGDIGLVVLASHGMWHGLQKYFGFAEGRPTLLVDCNPIFFDCLMPLGSLRRVYGSEPENDKSYLFTLKHSFPTHATIRLSAPGGTCLTFTARDWQVDPWTEIHTSPVEHSITGKIVADASVFFSKVLNPIELTI